MWSSFVRLQLIQFEVWNQIVAFVFFKERGELVRADGLASRDVFVLRTKIQCLILKNQQIFRRWSVDMHSWKNMVFSWIISEVCAIISNPINLIYHRFLGNTLLQFMIIVVAKMWHSTQKFLLATRFFKLVHFKFSIFKLLIYLTFFKSIT